MARDGAVFADAVVFSSPGATITRTGSHHQNGFSQIAEWASGFAGFSEYTDHQIGRIVDYLAESGQLENTIVLYCAVAPGPTWPAKVEATF